MPYGSKPGEDPDAVADAFRQTDSYHAAARMLNSAGVKTRRGGPWWATSVREVLKKHAPELIPAGQVQRAESAPPFVLARLLRCSCGRTLTGVVHRGHRRYVCTRGVDQPDHPRPKSTSEAKVLPWVRAEAARFDRERTLERNAPDERRRDLEDQLDRLSRQHQMGVIDDVQLTRRAGEVQQELLDMQSTQTLTRLPDAIDWEDDDPRAINAVLRAYWDHVQLDENLLPTGAVWRFDPDGPA